MTFGETKRVTVRVGVSTLPLWERAARKALAWNLQDWIAETCNARARELLADELAAEARAERSRPAGPARVNGKGGRR